MCIEIGYLSKRSNRWNWVCFWAPRAEQKLSNFCASALDHGSLRYLQPLLAALLSTLVAQFWDYLVSLLRNCYWIFPSAMNQSSWFASCSHPVSSREASCLLTPRTSWSRSPWTWNGQGSQILFYSRARTVSWWWTPSWNRWVWLRKILSPYIGLLSEYALGIRAHSNRSSWYLCFHWICFYYSRIQEMWCQMRFWCIHSYTHQWHLNVCFPWSHKKRLDTWLQRHQMRALRLGSDRLLQLVHHPNARADWTQAWPCHDCSPPCNRWSIPTQAGSNWSTASSCRHWLPLHSDHWAVPSTLYSFQLPNLVDLFQKAAWLWRSYLFCSQLRME